MSDHVAGDGTLPTPPAAAEATCPRCASAVPRRAQQPDTDAFRASLPDQIRDALEHTGSLSRREIDVFELLSYGYSNRQIAQLLKFSERTAKRHVSEILRKLGLESRLQAGLVAMLTRWLQINTPSGPKVVFTDSGATEDTIEEN